jgi:hypothetical protein
MIGSVKTNLAASGASLLVAFIFLSCGNLVGETELSPLHVLSGETPPSEEGTRYIVLGWIPTQATADGQSIWVKGPHAAIEPDGRWTLPLWDVPPSPARFTGETLKNLLDAPELTQGELALGVLAIVDVFEGKVPNNWADMYNSPDIRVRAVSRDVLLGYANGIPSDLLPAGFSYVSTKAGNKIVASDTRSFEFNDDDVAPYTPLLRCGSVWDWPSIEHLYPGFEGVLPEPGSGICRGCDRRIELETCSVIGEVLCTECELIIHRLLDYADAPENWPCGLQEGSECDEEASFCSASGIFSCIDSQWRRQPRPETCEPLVACCGEFCEAWALDTEDFEP